MKELTLLLGSGKGGVVIHNNGRAGSLKSEKIGVLVS